MALFYNHDHIYQSLNDDIGVDHKRMSNLVVAGIPTLIIVDVRLFFSKRGERKARNYAIVLKDAVTPVPTRNSGDTISREPGA